ncbi:MAG: hypothetical protein COV36_03090 [Alphaproteobacteria bacterium CG11_big_fil_rev_8_21_14_0_20_44_7]|nr:MAG: hypothetical protein COV36_03090 [Alphaproteobacteria bacterium CG11_big_fil_rev_8_21_14_0_20_44_7]
MKNYYRILCIGQGATQVEIKKAHRKAVLKYHPDKNSNSDAMRMFGLVQEAYETLSDSVRRLEYDKALAREAKRAEKKKQAPPQDSDDMEEEYGDDFPPEYSRGKDVGFLRAKSDYPDFEEAYTKFVRFLDSLDYRKGDEYKRRPIRDDKISDRRTRMFRLITNTRADVAEELRLLQIQREFLASLYEYLSIEKMVDNFNPYRELHEAPSNLDFYENRIEIYRREIAKRKPKTALAVIPEKKKRKFFGLFGK